MEINTVCLDTAKKLKQAGFPQTAFSVWEWSAGIPAGEAYLVQPELIRRYGLWGTQDMKDRVSAPTSTEIYLASGRDPRRNLAMPEEAAQAWLNLQEEKYEMKKIISLYQRNYETDRLVRDEVVPGAEWVQAGEGVATRKYDGTCCLVEAGRLFKRYEVKRGKTPPFGFVPANDVDPTTGKQQGWVEVGNGNEDRAYREAVGGNPDKVDLPNGTYELVGPKVQSNPEHYEAHTLVMHDMAEVLSDAPRTFGAIKAYLVDKDIEGIVWHHPDGRMVKIKKKDFGLKRQEVAA